MDQNYKVLGFRADWCPHCKIIPHVLQNIQEKGYKTEQVDVDENPELKKTHSIKIIPSLIAVDSMGIEFERLDGDLTDNRVSQFLKRINEY